MSGMKTLAAAAALFASGPALANEPFSWTGSYDGMFVCDQVVDGVFGTFARKATVKILQTGDEIDMELDTAVRHGSRPVPTSYRGSVMTSSAGDVTTGYVEPCRDSFSFREIVRFFPASAVTQGFGLTADSIFHSKDLPALEGKLVIHACKLSITRTSNERPELRTCSGR